MNHYFITGVSSGIGRALVKALLESTQDAMIYGCSRRDPGFTDPKLQFQAIDLADTDQLTTAVQDFFNVAIHKTDRLILINNAGTIGDVAFTGQQTAAHYSQTFAVNTLAPILLTETFIHRFQSFEGEKIIFNISSGAASKDIAGWAAYCASKAALDRFTTVAVEEQKQLQYPVQLYSLSPGVVDTAMQEEIRNSKEEQFPSLDRFVALHRQGELLPAEAAAQKIIRLLNEPELRQQTFLSLRDLS